MDIVIKLSALFVVLLVREWYFLLIANSLNFGSKIMIARPRQWWRFSFVKEMRNLFFM